MPTTGIGSVSQQKHGKITPPEPYEPMEVIIIILDIIWVKRLVIDSKGSVVNANGPKLSPFHNKNTERSHVWNPKKPLEVIIILIDIIGVSRLVIDSKREHH